MPELIHTPSWQILKHPTGYRNSRYYVVPWVNQISKTCSSNTTETLHPWNNHSLFTPVHRCLQISWEKQILRKESRNHRIFFSLSNILHFAWQTLGPPMSLQMAQLPREFFSTGVKPNSSIFTIDCLYFTFSEIQYHPKILLLLSQLNSQLNFPKIPNLAKQIKNSN